MRRLVFACVALASTGCAGLLGLDEFTEGEGSGPGSGGGSPTTTGDPTPSSTGTAGDGGSGAGTGDGGGGGTVEALAVSPEGPVKVGVLRAQQFTSTAPVTWSVDEEDGGTIDDEGFYVAPEAPGTYHVTATSTADPEERVTVTVNAAPLALRVVAGEAGGPGTIDGPLNRSRVDRVGGMVPMDFGDKILFSDEGAHTIRVLENGVVTTIAGRPYDPGAVDGPADQARFRTPGPVAADRDSSIAFVFDRENYCIRRINTANGTVSTLAGECGARDHVDASAGADVRFEEVSSMVMGPEGDRLYACEVSGNTRSIRVIHPTTGATTSILQDQLGTPISWDCRLATHYYAYVYVYGGGDQTIRRFEDRPQFDMTTVSQIATVPEGLWLQSMTAMTGYGDDAIFASNQRTIYRLSLETPQDGFLPAIGANDEEAYVDGPWSEARLTGASAMTSSYRDVYFADFAASIRHVDTEEEDVSTVAGQPANVEAVDGPLDDARLVSPFAFEIDDDGNAYVAEFVSEGGNVIRKIDAATGELAVFTGANPDGEFLYVDGAADEATFGFIIDIVRVGDALYTADVFTHTIRRISLADGSVTTIAGQPMTEGFEDGFADAARFDFEQGGGLATDGTDLYVADSNNHAIRKIDLVTNEVTTIAGGTQGIANGVGLEAEFMMPVGLAEEGGVLYIADYLDHVIRRMDLATGEVTTLLGLSGSAGQVDGGAAEATFLQPFRLETDGLGNLFVTTLGGFDGGIGGLLIRRIDLDDVVVGPFAGSRTQRGFSVGQLPGTVGCPSSLRVDASGDLLFSDFCDGVVGVIQPI